MKAMIWKEWRENFKWAVLGAGGLALATLYALSQQSHRYAGANGEQAWWSATMMTTIGAPLIATILGFLQILPEQRRDQWAFLLHRPATRSVIFGGKVSVGLALYLLATVPVVVGLNLWFATPGHVVMPYDWHMSLTGMGDICDGVIFYFAAVLTALRPARWYGSRTLGLAMAVLAGPLAVTFHLFCQTLLTVLLCALMLGLAAWGSFLTDGTYRLQPKSAKFSLAATLLVGTVVVTGAGLLFLVTIKDGFSPPSTSDSIQYQIDQKGRVLRVTFDGSRVKQATDFNGKPVQYIYSSTANLSTFVYMRGLDLSDSGQSFAPPWTYRDIEHYFNPLYHDFMEGGTTWFYVYNQRLLEGFANKDKKFIGYLGPHSSTPTATPPDTRFPGLVVTNSLYYNAQLLRFPQAVYWAGPAESKITLITQQQPGAIRGVCMTQEATVESTAPQDSSSLNAIAIVVNKQIKIFSTTGKLLVTTPLHYDVPNYSSLEVGAIQSAHRYFFKYVPLYERELALGHRLPSYIVKVSETGAVLQRYTLPPLDALDTPVAWGNYLSAPVMPSILMAGLAIYAAAFKLPPRHFGLPNGLIFVALNILAALLVAALTWRLDQRCAFNRREQWAWAITVFCLGPFGFLMLLALQGWPARQSCPNCGQQRVVTHEHCEHCGAAFPQPSPDGTEIFETAIPIEPGPVSSTGLFICAG